MAREFGVVVWNVTLGIESGILTPGTLVDMDGWGASEAVIEGGSFHDGYCTAGRFKSPFGTVKNSTFERSCLHSLWLTPAPAWLEGPMRAPNMSFAGNRLTAVGRTPVRTLDVLAPGLRVTQCSCIDAEGYDCECVEGGAL